MTRHIISPSNSTTRIVAISQRRSVAFMNCSEGLHSAEQKGGGVIHVPEKGKRKFDPDAEETIFIPAMRGG